jgi:hypothetical protein
MSQHNRTKTQKRNRQNPRRRQISRQTDRVSSINPYTSTSNFSALTRCSLPRGIQLFPDVLDTHMRTIVELGMSGSAASQHSYHLNSPAKQFGPQVNWTGAFTDNVPAGIFYLLSSNTTAGSVAPYFLACTTEIQYELELININSIAAYATVVPSYQVSLSGMTQSQLAEQRGAVQQIVPASQAILPPKIKGRYSVHEIYGTTRNEVLTNSNYRQLAGSLPPISMYLHLIVASVDGTTSVAMQTKSTFTFTTRFSTINSFVTTVPA